MSIKVISFNLLSPFLCNPTQFQNYHPDHLNPEIRLHKILQILNTMLKDKPIICLQEVSFNWKGDIERFFHVNNYYFFCINYNKVGTGIAIPIDTKILKVDYIQVGKHIKSNHPERIFNWKEEERNIRKSQEPEKGFFKNLLETLEELAHSREESIKVIEDLIDEAKYKQNIAVKLHLKMNEKEFIIYNYHMPCTFMRPIIQSLHIDALKSLINAHSLIPTILVGDFNIKPNSTQYDYITKGIIEEEHNIYLYNTSHTSLTMKSVFEDGEPSFTCFSDTKFGGAFKDTLDYIFVTKNIKSLDAERLILSATKMPNDICPSDHLPIYAKLEL